MVRNTEFTVTDASGKALCHAASQSKRNLDSKRKRQVREGFALMVAAAGMARGSQVQCSLTGAWFTMADATTDPTDLIVIDRGHVISDEHDGAMCPCNLVPELRAHNKAHGKGDLDSSKFISDPRHQWRAVWEQHYASASKRSRAI